MANSRIQRISGHVTVSRLENNLRKSVVSVENNSVVVGVIKQIFSVVAADFTSDIINTQQFYYASVRHNLRSTAFVVSICDEHTGKDIIPYKTDKISNTDIYKFWLPKAMPSITVTIIG